MAESKACYCFTLDHLSLEQRQKLLEKFEMIMLKVDQQRKFEELYANGDENYPSQYDFGGELRGSYGCKDLARSITRKSKHTPEQSYTTSYNSEYNYDLSQTVSHVTVPFLPNDETNGDGPQLKLEEFSTTSFKVCVL